MIGVRFRIYDDNESSIIGVSPPIGQQAPSLVGAELCEYLSAQGAGISTIDTPAHLGHIATEYYAVQPPLNEQQIRVFARLCLGAVNKVGSDAMFIDNRDLVPERQLQTAGRVIASL